MLTNILTIQNKLEELEQRQRQYVAEPHADSKECVFNENPFESVEELKEFDRSIKMTERCSKA